MKKYSFSNSIFFWLLVLVSFAVNAQVSGNPSSFNNGIKLPNATEVVDADSIPVMSNDGIIKKWISKANLIAGSGGGGGSSINYYETVTSIPSYLAVDDTTVVDNGDTTYDILITPTTSINASQFGVKADLTYLDVTTDGTTATVLSSSFAADDVGKTLYIKKGYLNPDTATGSELPNTVLGRLVTVRATILSVNAGVSAVIDVIPNQAGTLRAMKFTNNYEKLQQAINFCHYKKILNLHIDLSGIIGIDVRSKGIYSAINPRNSLYVQSDISPLKIVGTGKIKFCNEGDTGSLLALFALKIGNNDFTLDVPCLPPDQHIINPQASDLCLINCNSISGNAGNSIRTINILNQRYVASDVDNNDAFWTHPVLSSGGGIYNSSWKNPRKSQIINIINCHFRTKSGGFSVFQQDGYSAELNIKDTYLEYSNNFIGENGRSFAADAYDQPLKWQFTNFTLASNVLTAPASSDFSFYDFVKNDIDYTVKIGGVTKNIVSITNAKTAVIASGISDGSGLTVEIGISGRDFYEHPMYSHPSIICKIENFAHTNTTGFFKFYSASGTVDSSRGKITINNSSLTRFQVQNGSASTTSTTVEINNSTLVTTSEVGGYVSIGHSNISGGDFSCKTFFSKGNNIWNVTTGSVSESTYFNLIGEKGTLGLSFTASGAYVKVDNFDIDDSGRFPIAKNGTTDVMNMYLPDRKFATLSTTYYTSSTVINFINVKQTKQFSYGFLHNDKLSSITWNFINSNVPTNQYGFLPFNEVNTHKNNGCFEVTSEFRNYYALMVSGSGWTNARWNQYKEFWFAVINPLESNYHTITNNPATGILASFNVLRKTAPAATNTKVDDSDYHHWNRFPVTRGYLTVKFDSGAQINPYYNEGAGTFNSKLRENTTITNTVQKSIERQAGEIVKFLVDPKQGRLIEVESSVEKHFVAVKPTRYGLEGEKVYLNDNSGIYYEYEMQFEDISGDYFTATVTNVDEKDDTNVTTQTNTHIDTGEYFSILQEKRDGTAYVDFSFSLIKDDDSEMLFTTQNIFDDNRIANLAINANYTGWFWEFTHSSNTERAFINNRTGQIVIDGVLAATLKASNNVKINSGYRVTSQQWVKKSDKGTVTADTSTNIELFNVHGNICNELSPNTNISFTTSDAVVNGTSTVRINCASEPVIYELDGVTPATKRTASTFVASTDMDLVVTYTGNSVEYYFLEI